MDTFIVESFVPHAQRYFAPKNLTNSNISNSDEYYICMQSVREGTQVFFYHEGGVDIGDVDEKANKYTIIIDDEFTHQQILVKENFPPYF